MSVKYIHTSGRRGALAPLFAVLLGLFAMIANLPAVAQGQRVLLDRIIAIVDDDVVLQSELELRLADISAAAARAGQPLPDAETLRAEVLDTLILENIQMQLAERVSIRFDDDTINRVLLGMAEQNNLSFDQYVATLEQSGVYLQTRDQVRMQMTMQELQRGMVNRRITITEQEIDNFLNSEMGREIMAAEYFIDHMVVTVSATDSDDERAAKLKYAADLIARTGEGENFPDVRNAARQQRLFPVNATEFGWRQADDLPTIFSEIVAGMERGQVEGPIVAGNGYHIIHLAGKRGGTEQFVSQTDVRHIMLAPNEIRDDEQSRVAIEELRRRILAGEDFASLARQNSDDATSVVAGGDLDWINEGGMPAEFEAAINTLEEGELSEPFRSATGWHIAEVLGRRETDLSLEFSRAQAENTLRGRKFDLELQNWLLEIREDAFVELVE